MIRDHRRLFSGSILCAILFASLVRAADVWTLSTSDFTNQSVLLKRIDANGISVVVPPSTQPSLVSAEQFLSLDRTSESSQAPKLKLVLQNGDELAGEPASLDGDTLHWRESVLGPMGVPLSNVKAIIRSRWSGGAKASQPKEALTDDVATLTNGDAVHGVIAALTAQTVSMQRPDGTVVPVAIDSVNTLRFAATGQPASAPAVKSDGSFRLKLSDGSTITGSGLAVQQTVQPQAAEMTFSDGQRRNIPLNAVISIEQMDGPVAWLSEQPPSENLQTPMFDRAAPARFDRSVTGTPIQFADRTFEHGIGVHAYSRLSWPVGPRDQVFRTQFAIHGDSPYADVDVRIKLDGQTASETRHVQAGVLSPVVWLDVDRVHTVTLEVEAANDNVQARLNWIEPALLRFKPTTRP